MSQQNEINQNSLETSISISSTEIMSHPKFDEGGNENNTFTVQFRSTSRFDDFRSR